MSYQVLFVRGAELVVTHRGRCGQHGAQSSQQRQCQATKWKVSRQAFPSNSTHQQWSNNASRMRKCKRSLLNRSSWPCGFWKLGSPKEHREHLTTERCWCLGNLHVSSFRSKWGTVTSWLQSKVCRVGNAGDALIALSMYLAVSPKESNGTRAQRKEQ